MKYKYVFLLGRPGCGKSALIQAIVGEMSVASGSIPVQNRNPFFTQFLCRFVPINDDVNDSFLSGAGIY